MFESLKIHFEIVVYFKRLPANVQYFTFYKEEQENVILKTGYW